MQVPHLWYGPTHLLPRTFPFLFVLLSHFHPRILFLIFLLSFLHSFIHSIISGELEKWERCQWSRSIPWIKSALNRPLLIPLTNQPTTPSFSHRREIEYYKLLLQFECKNNNYLRLDAPYSKKKKGYHLARASKAVETVCRKPLRHWLPNTFPSLLFLYRR